MHAGNIAKFKSGLVTGVQTCALPISCLGTVLSHRGNMFNQKGSCAHTQSNDVTSRSTEHHSTRPKFQVATRSFEARVNQ